VEEGKQGQTPTIVNSFLWKNLNPFMGAPFPWLKPLPPGLTSKHGFLKELSIQFEFSRLETIVPCKLTFPVSKG
jgi:hypothetical protein